MRIGRLLLIGLLLLVVVFVPAGVPAAPCSQSLISPAFSLLTFLIPSAAACPGPDFTLTANPGRLTIAPGATGTASISLSSIDSFNGNVSLSTSAPACPSSGCSSWSINPVSVVLKANGTAASTLKILDGTSWPGPGNSANITIYGTSGNLTRSAIVSFTTSSSPDFTISVSPANQTVQPGGTAKSTIVLTSVNGFSGTISFSTPLFACFTYCWSFNPVPVILPAGGTVNSTLTITTTTNIQPGSYFLDMGAISGNLSHGVIVHFTVSSPIPDFGMTANPNSLTLTAGSSGASTIRVTSLNGFSGTVGLSTLLVPCSTFCWNLTPMSVNLSSGATANSTLTITTTTSIKPGNYSIPVQASSGGLSHQVIVYFTVPSSPTSDFGMTASPNSLQLAAGSTGTSAITVTSLNGFSGTVSLQTFSPMCPGCTTWSIFPSSVTVSSNVSRTSTLTVTAGSVNPSGTINVTGTSNGLTHFALVQFTVNTSSDFTISANPVNVTIDAGSSGISTINVTSINGFAGTISLTAQVSPTGPTANLSLSSITLQGGGTRDSVLSIATTSSTTLGSYTITVTATSGTISHSIRITVTVLDPPPTGGGGGGHRLVT